MDLSQLDILFRAAGATALLCLATLLVRDGGWRGPGLLFVPLAIALAGFLAGNTPDPALRISGTAGEVAHILSGYAAAVLWWFCLACFDSNFRLRGPVLAVGLGWIIIASADRGLLGPALAGLDLSRLLVLIGFGMVAHLAWRLLRDRAGDLVESRRHARILVVVLLGGQLLLDLAVDLLLGFDWRPRWFAMAQNAAILGFTLWLAGRLLHADVARLSFVGPAEVAPVPATAPDADAGLVARLRDLVEVEKVHLDPELDFAGFVRKMGTSERIVRRLINHELGHDHFRSFLNACRTAEARRLLADPAHAGDKLIAIAQDSGFASLASFNRVFRRQEGCAPSAYRAAKAGSEERSAAF
ncbi:AraC family transcriptional regulator [Sphingosinicella sp. LHD-64]|uniref:AraC family transcriptional regulator n=1 Tax=Sphingosinicella sp. LHD-64 TaxID=3072139 RepID=UPI00280F2576|nr:AraC family transcriptional regulator [Sphingosinicella sp. LHD-64]MDQ8757308.1 AraC family transcriptional regulator [Sphingosinicella sp. LHD-64]